jgi:hypothetical protein
MRAGRAAREAGRLAGLTLLAVGNALLSYTAMTFYLTERTGSLSTLAVLVLCCWLAIELTLVVALVLQWLAEHREPVDEPDLEIAELFDRPDGG